MDIIPYCNTVFLTSCSFLFKALSGLLLHVFNPKWNMLHHTGLPKNKTLEGERIERYVTRMVPKSRKIRREKSLNKKNALHKLEEIG